MSLYTANDERKNIKQQMFYIEKHKVVFTYGYVKTTYRTTVSTEKCLISVRYVQLLLITG